MFCKLTFKASGQLRPVYASSARKVSTASFGKEAGWGSEMFSNFKLREVSFVPADYRPNTFRFTNS
jgi:hypothetical protein